MFSVFGLIDWISLFLVSNYKVSLLLFFLSQYLHLNVLDYSHSCEPCGALHGSPFGSYLHDVSPCNVLIPIHTLFTSFSPCRPSLDTYLVIFNISKLRKEINFHIVKMGLIRNLKK